MRNITMVGYGMIGSRDVTAGGESRIREADLVVYSSTWPGIAHWLSECGAKRTENISELYVENGSDEENYDAIVGKLLALSGEFADIVYIVPGTPTLGVTATKRLKTFAENNPDVHFEVLPGVSSFDSIGTDLLVDFLERGTLVVDSNRLLMYCVQIDPTMGVLIYHPASVGDSNVNFNTPWTTNRLDLLQEYLLRYYPEDHPFSVVVSASAPGRNIFLKEGILGRLTDSIRDISYGASLYIPPVAEFRLDREFLSLLLKREV